MAAVFIRKHLYAKTAQFDKRKSRRVFAPCKIANLNSEKFPVDLRRISELSGRMDWVLAKSNQS